MNKYLYLIKKLKIKPWIKYWLIKQTEFKGVLSDILEGINFYLTDSLNMKFKIFKIYGRTTQDGDPTPENPVPIKNTGDNGSVNEKVQNKNLFDYEAYIKNGHQYSFNVIPGKQLYRTSNFGSLSNWKVYDKNNDLIETFSRENFPVTGSYTIPTNAKYIKVVQDDFGSNLAELYIGYSSNKTYVPHEEQNISFPLAEGQKFMQGDYLADDGVHHVMAEYQMTGNESLDCKNVTDENIHFSSGVLDSLSNGKEKSALCTHFKLPATSLWATDIEGFAIVENYYHLRFRLNKSKLNDISTKSNAIDSFRAYLRNQYANKTPVKVQYELAQEVVDPYTPEQQTVWEQIKRLRTYKNVTHISSEDETPAELKIQYYKEG